MDEIHRIYCPCGIGYDGFEHETCPLCGEPSSRSQVSQRDADAMLVELRTLLDEHGTTAA